MSLRIASKFRFRSDRFACDLGPFWVNVGCISGPFWGCQVGSNANLRRIGPQVASKAVPIRFLAGPCAKVIWIDERIACSAPRGNHRKSSQISRKPPPGNSKSYQSVNPCDEFFSIYLSIDIPPVALIKQMHLLLHFLASQLQLQQYFFIMFSCVCLICW